MAYRTRFTRTVACRMSGIGAAVVLAATLATGCAPSVNKYAARSAAADSAVREALRTEQTIRPTDIPANTVGVMPLTVRSADTSYASLGYGVGALLASDLAQSKSIVVVERLKLDAVMRELNLAATGRVDSSTAPRAGRIVGARRLVVGSLNISPNGALQIGSQVANATSGRVDASLSGNATVDQIFDAEKAMAFRLLEAMGITLSPEEQRALERRPTRNLAALLAFSNGVRAELNRDFDGAVRSYNEAARLDPGFAEASALSSMISGNPIDGGTQLNGVNRAAAISTDLVNRPTPVLLGSGVDAPATRQQLINITITVRTP